MPAKKKKFYAYVVPIVGAGSSARAEASKEGITDNWAACEKMVSGKNSARFKSFDDRAAAAAWLAQGAMYETRAVRPRPTIAPGIYFDAGTGRGNGVEISVTDEHGKNLLHKVLAPKALNKFGKHLIISRGRTRTTSSTSVDGAAEATNNYGELLALRYALEIAAAEKIKNVFGDSKLVIEFWSQWRMKRKTLPEETVTLADDVSRLREKFEAAGGIIQRISGDFNPADLGFHR